MFSFKAGGLWSRKMYRCTCMYIFTHWITFHRYSISIENWTFGPYIMTKTILSRTNEEWFLWSRILWIPGKLPILVLMHKLKSRAVFFKIYMNLKFWIIRLKFFFFLKYYNFYIIWVHNFLYIIFVDDLLFIE